MDFLIPAVLAILVPLCIWRRRERKRLRLMWANALCRGIANYNDYGRVVLISNQRGRQPSLKLLALAALLIPMLFTGCGLVTPEQQSRIVDAGINRLLGPPRPAK